MNRLLFYHSLWMFLCTILFFPVFSDAQDKLRVGLSSVSATSGSIWVAEGKVLFKKHGIDAEVIIIGGGASRVVSSLIAGEIQFSVGGGDSVVRSALRGADTVLVASPLKTGLQRLMVRPDIKTPAELKSKKIGITRFGSASHWVLQLFLRKWGIRSEDIQMVQLGSSPAMFASLEKGAIEGAVFTIPTFFVAEDRGYRILADPVDLDIYYLQNSVDSTKSLLRQKTRPSRSLRQGNLWRPRVFQKEQDRKSRGAAEEVAHPIGPRERFQISRGFIQSPGSQILQSSSLCYA